MVGAIESHGDFKQKETSKNNKNKNNTLTKDVEKPEPHALLVQLL